MANGKTYTVKFETKKQLDAVRRAAKSEERSMNSFIIRESVKAAEQVMKQKEQLSTPA